MKARRAFEDGQSNRAISRIAGASQLVWEKELRSLMGDAAFEHQMAQNKQANRAGGRPRRERPTVRQQVARTVSADRRRSGKTVPVVCVETGEAFGSIGRAAKAMELKYHQVRHSVFGDCRAFRPDGSTVSFRRWREGDPEVSVQPVRNAIPLRFEDGRVWPSVSALAAELGAEPRHITRFCRRLKELGYGIGSEPLALAEMRILAELTPMLQRQQLENQIRVASR